MASQQQIGEYAFIGGVAISIIVGVLTAAGQASILGSVGAWVPLVLVVLGAVVGFLNIKDKEIDKFLIATIALLTMAGSAGGLNLIPVVGVYLASVVQNVAVFVAPAALITAIVLIKHLASEQVN